MSRQVYSQSCDVLGTTVDLWLVSENVPEVESWFVELWKIVNEFKNRFSRFSETSELTHFNHQAGAKTSISPDFKELLQSTKYFFELTDGLFNPFILPQLQQAGYLSSMTDSNTHSSDFTARKLASFDTLEIGDTWAYIPTEAALDFGGIGKGFLADKLANWLRPYTKDFCLSLGGDIHISGQRPTGPWEIEIETTPQTTIKNLTYSSATVPYGIATSGLTRKKQNKSQKHIIDPRTGVTAESQYEIVTVVANDTVTADVLASCILIAGEDFTQKMFSQGYARAVLSQDALGNIRTLGNDFITTD